MRAHHHPADTELSIPTVQDPVWSIAQPGRHWPLRQSRRSASARIDPTDPRVPVDLAEERMAERQLVELEELLISPTPVYCRGVAMASQILSEVTGPLYRPQRRGELRERAVKVLGALRGSP